MRAIADDSDAQALAALYDRYVGLLLALAQRVVGRHPEAEEVVQEVFVQVWDQARRYDPSKASVSTWLVLITRSRAVDRLRRRQVRRRAAEAHGGEVGSSRPEHTSEEGSSRVLYEERRRRVLEALAGLPEEQREALELSYFDGMTQRQIAETHDLPLGTVKTRVLLAMKKLRSALRDEVRELL